MECYSNSEVLNMEHKSESQLRYEALMTEARDNITKMESMVQKAERLLAEMKRSR
jgi:hypothetical protein